MKKKITLNKLLKMAKGSKYRPAWLYTFKLQRAHRFTREQRQNLR